MSGAEELRRPQAVGSRAAPASAAARILSASDALVAEHGRVFMSGIQALVRLPLMQRRLDRRRGYKSAGLISGYRGSPLGGYDQALWAVRGALEAHDIIFQPGLNEDLAATALWGAQMHRAFGPVRAEGVFGLWYGKGPGVDRSADVLRSANMMGASPLGGVLAVAGDDHAAQSSTFPHQTDGVFQACSMPVLQPATVREILTFGLAGWALSRATGLWVGMKTIAEVVERATVFDLPYPYPSFLTPDGIRPPGHGLNWDQTMAWPRDRAELERRLVDERLPAAQAWARVNTLDQTIVAPTRKRLGIVTVGKAHLDLMQAAQDLGLDPPALGRLGVGVYKVALSWPLEIQGLRDFALGYAELLVVEEKRGMVETQVKAALYGCPSSKRPKVIGKTDERGSPLLPEAGELDATSMAHVLADRLCSLQIDDNTRARLRSALTPRPDKTVAATTSQRSPFFCAGCPHNSSTRVPAGSQAGGGIGCHIMALSMPERRTSVFSQMGGEGLQWIGAAPFSHTRHVFQNLGDGTYQHSGVLAVRAAVAAGANITFKILYNDAVAMTGGQPAEGAIDPLRIIDQLRAEGVDKVVLISDDPAKWRRHAKHLAMPVDIQGREALESVQRALRETPGVTALVYDQTCAAEKRRRRKRLGPAAPLRRLVINHRVCEGCGDCSVQSNCIAIEPRETLFGRKRRVNQTACNDDAACVQGFCPSFVEIEGAPLRRPDPARLAQIEIECFGALPEPKALPPAATWNLYIAGIGGSGVLTLGALLGSAAHIAGQATSVLDFTGLSQKNGAVFSHVRLAPKDREPVAARIGAGQIDLLLATDLVAATTPGTLAGVAAHRTHAVINTDVAPTAAGVTDRDAVLPVDAMTVALSGRLAADRALSVPATRLAQGLFGDALMTNTLMLGFAWQRGLIPLPLDAILAAIARHNVAADLNARAFHWGRVAAFDIAAVERAADLEFGLATSPETLQSLAERYIADLTLYQSAAYAASYAALVAQASDAGRRAGDDKDRFARAVAIQAYRLMAYKDEYEIARLHTDAAFLAELDALFGPRGRRSIWLAPPLFAGRDPASGRPRKRKFGPWIFPVLRALARLKGLRGTRFDPFGWTDERRRERRLAAGYAAMIVALCETLTPDTLDVAIVRAGAPCNIRGFGPLKAAAIQDYDALVAPIEPGRADTMPTRARGRRAMGVGRATTAQEGG